MSKFLSINPKKEEQKITSFIRKVFKQTGFKKLIIGLSGGIDSTTSLYLIRKSLPPENIIVAHLYYFKPQISNIQHICSTLKIPAQNQYIISIKMPVYELKKLLSIYSSSDPDVTSGESRSSRSRQTRQPRSTWQARTITINNIRLGNIMARVRMIILFDLAKKHSALVCGTENKSEHYLGYFTRFGDAASDIEPIQHLYKSQISQLARYLNVPEEIIKARPTAGLWPGQTDERQFGFSYQEADPILYLYFDKKLTIREIEKLGHKNAKKVINFASKNSFKHKTPYNIFS
ncbi:NAD(+) synthase [Candidatus Roizmanbacteria bacterium RIFCSPHIGHO2_02_FULL_38_11]|uniref:NH(3)-dependent NAD(+) synthetase n=1 Tax=Candidatus Roizmanbacteria bacterium RIFCSPHIGHO2_02_FULL_38_11 TaxID=1802039 RepID=A0A1F7GZV2_9BACT|nr:MAG: NAD(+) synthase [Candidatus Roizmanbacteria bacterium RIFCSPHIGHO2_02_FULL_38_11]